MKTILTLALALVAAATHAQVAQKPSLTLDGARCVIAAAEQFAKANNAPGGVIAVVDDGGNLIALERLEGTFAAGANISIGKARTAVLFKKPTRFFEELINTKRTAMTALNDFTPLQGGVPIVVNGAIVGGVGVSGAASAQQDEELAIAGANSLTANNSLGAAPQPSSPVTYLDKKHVSAAFAKGAPLLENTEYKVHASRREKAGDAEIHETETDVIYVVDGTATFVTGGKIVNPRNVGPAEIRGSGIEGGETHRLVKGDVIVVPENTPHWFKEASNPFQYFVVKPIKQTSAHFAQK